MNIRIIPVALAFSAFAFAAIAQTGGSMSGPTTGGAMSSSNHMAAPAGCTPTQNHMAGGAMASGDHMAGGSTSGGDHMAGGAMAGGDHMAGGAMAGGNHMAANSNGCPPAQKPNR